MVLSLNIKNEKITNQILDTLKIFKVEDLEIQKIDVNNISKQEKINALLSITNSIDMENKTLQQIKSEVNV